MRSDPGGHSDSDDSQDDKPPDDDDTKPPPKPDDDDNKNTGKGGPPSNVQVQVTQKRIGPLRRYAQAQAQPADRPNRQAAFSTGPGEAVEYHYHRVPTYAHQYATDMATGMENNPT